ncbi:MAG: SRPBCC domain-containing protein [Xanthobacteraceae bacterium]|nr:SRPBCC domain-containing protein [Xanthobacteraceae bacterium]
MNANCANGEAFVIIRTFDAPRDTVWKAWTDRDQRTQWWQPMGTPLEVKTYEVKPGGVMHYAMDMHDGGKWWGVFAYREVKAPSRLVYVNSCSDENGGITRHTLNAQWPLKVLTTVTFTENGDKTIVRLEGVPLDATDEERSVFENGIETMQKAFDGTFGQLEAYLASR